jgi:hypothetical protein
MSMSRTYEDLEEHPSLADPESIGGLAHETDAEQYHSLGDFGAIAA